MGLTFENDPLFPERVNTEFVSVVNSHTLQMRVWERGSGDPGPAELGHVRRPLRPCCAAIARKGETVTVRLKGGELSICYTEDAVLMTGEAKKVFEGVIEI